MSSGGSCTVKSKPSSAMLSASPSREFEPDRSVHER